MSDRPPAQALEGARAYERLHVQALFAEWAPRMMDALDLGVGDDLLDVASGTGILARSALERVGSGGRVTGLDLDPAMLAVAREIEPGVTWCQGDATDLPFEPASFDAVANQFGIMFVSDPALAIGEMVRVAKPGGRIAVAVWDALEASPAYPLELDLLEQLAGSEAAEALRAPFVLGDPAAILHGLELAGAHRVSVATIVGRARFTSIRAMVEADLRGWLPVMGVHLDEPTIRRILARADAVLTRFLTAEGALEFDSPAHIISAINAPLSSDEQPRSSSPS